MKREEDEDYWVKKFEEEFQLVVGEEQQDIKDNKKFWEHCIIVDDCRYPNELRFGIKYKASLIFLSYGNREMIGPKGEWRKHHSEEMAQIIDGGSEEFRQVFTSILNNQDDIKALKKKAASLIPIWCGIQPEEKPLTREEQMAYLNQAISDLIDLLILGELDEDEDGA